MDHVKDTYKTSVLRTRFSPDSVNPVTLSSPSCWGGPSAQSSGDQPLNTLPSLIGSRFQNVTGINEIHEWSSEALHDCMLFIRTKINYKSKKTGGVDEES